MIFVCFRSIAFMHESQRQYIWMQNAQNAVAMPKKVKDESSSLTACTNRKRFNEDECQKKNRATMISP